METRVCNKCGIEKPLLEGFRYSPTMNPNQKNYYRKECRECERRLGTQVRMLRKVAPPKPIKCPVCNQEDVKIILDHDHKTGQFRGWICDPCNRAIGQLGDNIEGLQSAMDYLEGKKDPENALSKLLSNHI